MAVGHIIQTGAAGWKPMS